MLLATKGSVYCNFPEYLWRPLPDGGERKWLNRVIYEGNSEIWTRRKEIVVFHNEITTSLVSRVTCTETSNSTAPPGVCERTKVRSQLLYEQLRPMDTRHFVILWCRHLANGFVLKCGCIGLMLFHNLSCLNTITCYINTVGIVPAYACNNCDALVASCATTG